MRLIGNYYLVILAMWIMQEEPQRASPLRASALLPSSKPWQRLWLPATSPIWAPRVVKIERIGEGDFARAYDHAVHGLSSHFVWLNRSKKSVAIDLKSEAGVALLADLIARADVFIQNLAPGAAQRLGLSASALRERHRELIVANLSGYGDGGPLATRKAYDMLVQAETGLVSVTGTPDAATKTGVPTSDIAAGMYVVVSVLSALLRRARTGVGAEVSVSMFDATAEWLGHPMYLAMYAGRQVPRMGLSHASIAPYNGYATADGQEVLIGIQNDRGWDALCRNVFSNPNLAEDPRFATNRMRVRHRAACDAEVAAQTCTWRGEDLERRLDEAGIPAARINDIAGLVGHPRLADRDRWREVGSENGKIRALRPPMTFADIELVMGDIPALGQNTAEVLANTLGLDASRLGELYDQGIIG